MSPRPQTPHRPAATAAALAGAALVGAVLPAAAALAFLISLAARRPLVAAAARRWPRLTGHPAARVSRRAATGLTAAWGTGMLAAAAIQGAGALTGALSLTTPAGFTTRALIALAIEAILTATTLTWLRRSPAARSGGHTRDPGHSTDNPCPAERNKPSVDANVRRG